MASLMENLIGVLVKENEEYELLITLSKEKTTYIIEGNLEGLSKITDEEQIVVSKIHQLEKQREDTINDIADVINKDVKTLKLVNLIQMLANRPEEQKQLAKVHDKLQETLGQMNLINEHNKMLLANALEMVEFDINLLQSMKTAPQTANYDKGAYRLGEVYGSNKGTFDAKQ